MDTQYMVIAFEKICKLFKHWFRFPNAGFYRILGMCQHTNGDELESCWVAVEGIGHLSDYVYGSTASGNTCYLDEANGYDFTEGQTSDGYVGYGYVTTTQFSGVPIGFMGTEFGDICGFTP